MLFGFEAKMKILNDFIASVNPEVMDRPGYGQNNAMVFIINGTVHLKWN